MSRCRDIAWTCLAVKCVFACRYISDWNHVSSSLVSTSGAVSCYGRTVDGFRFVAAEHSSSPTVRHEMACDIRQEVLCQPRTCCAGRYRVFLIPIARTTQPRLHCSTFILRMLLIEFASALSGLNRALPIGSSSMSYLVG